MPELPYLHILARDDLSSTSHMTTLAFGAYSLLRYHYWLRQGPLAHDRGELARLARVSLPEWKRIEGEVLRMFEPLTMPDETRWLSNPGLDDALRTAKERSAKASASAQQRWSK